MSPLGKRGVITVKPNVFMQIAEQVITKHFEADIEEYRAVEQERLVAMIRPKSEAARSVPGVSEVGLGTLLLAAAWVSVLSDIYKWIEENGVPQNDAEKKKFTARLKAALDRAQDKPADTLHLASAIVVTVLETLEKVGGV